MITPLDGTIKEVMNLTWPMIMICVVIVSSLRIFYIFKNKKEFVFYKEIFFLMFMIYILCMFQVVTFEDPAVGLSSNNFTPLKEIMRYSFGSRLFFKNVVGNLIMFVPYGIFASIFVKTTNKWESLFLIILASVTIESTQAMIGRVFDIDDILLNVCGGMIGYLIYYIVGKISDRLPKIFRSNMALNIFTTLLLCGMIYYVWKVI